MLQRLQLKKRCNAQIEEDYNNDKKADCFARFARKHLQLSFCLSSLTGRLIFCPHAQCPVMLITIQQYAGFFIVSIVIEPDSGQGDSPITGRCLVVGDIMLIEQFPDFKSFVVWHVAESKKKSGQSGLSYLGFSTVDD